MLSDDKIKKLLELANRGIDGEMENAKRILERNNIDWRNPPPLNFFQKAKKAVGLDPIKEHLVKIEYATDVLLMEELLQRITGQKIIHLRNNTMVVKATKTEMDAILKIYLKVKRNYGIAIATISKELLNKVWNT